MGKRRDEAFRRVEEKRQEKRSELLQEAEWCRSEIRAKHHRIRNSFKLSNIGKKLQRLR
jgi:DNA relaxase NicK